MVTHGTHKTLVGRMRSERGVSLIHVALAIFVVTAFSAFVLDHGVMLLARGQGQTVADSAALAGVTSRVKDEPGDADPAVNGITEKVIQQTVNQNNVFGGTSANIGRTWSWACPTGVTGWCVTVNVFRDGTNGSTPLPVYFANLLGVSSQKTRATATAVAKGANGSRCVKPWLIPDKWIEIQPPANRFEPPDDYVPYDYATNTPGSGYGVLDIGTTVVLRPGNPSGAISPSDFFEIEDASDYEESIVGCKIAKKVGDTVTVLPGFREGPTDHGVDALTADGPVDAVVGLFDPEQFAAQDRQSGTFPLTIVAFIGVRITGSNQGRTIEGTITGGVGDDMGPGPTPTGNGNLIRTIQLVR